MVDRRMRVGVICGDLPLDPSHLEIVGREVDLTVYSSRPQVSGAVITPRPDVSFPVRNFTPLVRSDRGHLVFVYPGLHRALDRDQPDVVHVISEPWGLLCVQAARWIRANRPARLVVHGCDTIWHHGGALERAGRRALLRFTMPTIDAWVAESDKALSVAGLNGLAQHSLRRRIHTNPRNGTLFRPLDPAQRSQAREAFGLAPGVAAIGLLGRLVPHKGVRLFLDAASLLLEEGFPARFFLAGDGPLRDEVQRRTSSDIQYLGTVSHPDGVLEFFSMLDVLACPSLVTPFWEDQGPRSVLEGMMCGCIPMGTRTGAIPEMLDGHGTLAESTEPTAVADALSRAAALSALPVERARLSAWAHDRFSARAVAGQLIELWQEVMSSPRGQLDYRKSAP